MSGIIQAAFGGLLRGLTGGGQQQAVLPPSALSAGQYAAQFGPGGMIDVPGRAPLFANPFGPPWPVAPKPSIQFSLTDVTRAAQIALEAEKRRYHLITEGVTHNSHWSGPGIGCKACSCSIIPPQPFREYARLNKKGTVRKDKGLHFIRVTTLTEMKDMRYDELMGIFSAAISEMLVKHLSLGKSPEPKHDEIESYLKGVENGFKEDEIENHLDLSNWKKNADLDVIHAKAYKGIL